MTKLEQEIFDAINKCYSDATETEAKAAAEVAKTYIEKAWIEGYYALANTMEVSKDQWMKENGIL